MHELSANALLIKRCGVSPRLGPKSCRMNFNQSERHRCWPLPGTCGKPGWIWPGSAAGEAKPAPLPLCRAVPRACGGRAGLPLCGAGGLQGFPNPIACASGTARGGGTRGGSLLSRLRCPGCREGPGILCATALCPDSPQSPILACVTPAVSFSGLCNAPSLLAWFCPSSVQRATLRCRGPVTVPGRGGGAGGDTPVAPGRGRV